MNDSTQTTDSTPPTQALEQWRNERFKAYGLALAGSFVGVLLAAWVARGIIQGLLTSMGAAAMSDPNSIAQAPFWVWALGVSPFALISLIVLVRLRIGSKPTA